MSRPKLCLGLAALAALACLVMLFKVSPLRRPVYAQLHALSYLRVGRFQKMIESRPSEWAGYLNERPILSRLAVQADHARGYYDRPFKLTLRQPTGAAIYYRTDGGVPTVHDARYARPITIDRTTLLSFAAIGSDLRAGPVETHSYLVGETLALPVLALAVQPTLLWNRHAGIYRQPHQRGRAWWRPAQAELFHDKNSLPLRLLGQIKIHGNWTRSAEKKSFQMVYDGIGANSMFASVGQRTLVVRASAIDVSYRLGDELFRSLYADAGGLTPSVTRVRLLLNGGKWGLYNLQDQIDQAYLQRTQGPGDYDLVDDAGFFETPDGAAWNHLLKFFLSRDLSQENNFAQAKQLIDIENFTDYWLFNIYAGNFDWPQNNYYAFRKRSGDGRWRWLSRDSDAAFDANKGLVHDTLTWATRGELRHDLSYSGTVPDDETWVASTAIIRGLLRNRSYQARFTRRFCELRNSYFQPRLLQARFQKIAAQIRPHLADDWERWPGSEQAYYRGVEGVRRFINERPAMVLEHFRKYFGGIDCSPSGL